MKIIGDTVGTTVPRTDFNQTDPKKADYLRGRERIATKDDLEKALSNMPESGASYEAGENISIENNIISVLTADEAEEDNTRPITSAAVHTQLGNIQALLETI